MTTSRRNLGWARPTALGAGLFHVIALPIFLCPALLRSACYAQNRPFRTPFTFPRPARQQSARLSHSSSLLLPKEGQNDSIQSFVRLPRQCTGCGAFSQTSHNGEPGFYSLSRRTVRAFLEPRNESENTKRVSEREIVETSLRSLGDEVLKSLNFNVPAPAVEQRGPPLCDRCHNLLHHQSGVSIHHPSVESIKNTILESPHKYNHVYHVIDAADFPMSLIPRIHQLLHLSPQRSLNRRSKRGNFYYGRKNELSFIITRSDLLAPSKTQVDSLMPYLVSVLRDALGSVGKGVRLGNVRCVSSIRGWWTKELKEDIWNRGGGGWMVGKANVGKSQLFESVFPKGRRGLVKLDQSFQTDIGEHLPSSFSDAPEFSKYSFKRQEKISETESLDSTSLLPPPQPEVNYPAMPLVSPLPGTTASPIRVPFGNGKGELIDLPGLSRGGLELYVQEARRHSLVMQSRIRPKQQVVKPGQSLLLGGLIRITPITSNTIILAYAFTPMLSHLTSTDKAIGIQTQQRESAVQNISVVGIGEKIKSAGKFCLKWDVTRQRSGPITTHDAAGIAVDRLPYRVLSTDILIEGCGWVELVAQVRTKVLESTSNLFAATSSNQVDESPIAEPYWPEVEVFSPEGRFIAARRPLGAWILSGQMISTARMKGRPRRSMKGMKKKMKALRRMAED